jgi:hypothetical protein
MSTFAIVVILLAVASGVTFLLMKKGKIQDANNNNIPDAIEEKVEEVKVVVKKAKAKAEKVKTAVAEVAKVAEKVKKPATKKAATKKVK